MSRAKGDTKSDTKGGPSYQQIQYLMELEKIGNRRGCVQMAADACGVSHGTVSRFFKSCSQQGILDGDYRFTEKGQRMLAMYRRLFRDVEAYLIRIGSREQEIPALTRNLIENIDYHLLARMIRNDQTIRQSRENGGYAEDVQSVLGNVLRKGSFQVGIAVYRADGLHGTEYSMAHRGFERTAVITINKRGSWLELTACAVTARSRIDGKEMVGQLRSLKYSMNGELTEARRKEGRLRIPLEACRIQKSGKGNIKGLVPITVTCTAGDAHMPESTAYLMFWL